MPASSPTRSACGSVLIHPLSGVLSAYGMGLAELKATRTQAVLTPARCGRTRRRGSHRRASRRRGNRGARRPRRCARPASACSVLAASPLSRHRQLAAGTARHACRSQRTASRRCTVSASASRARTSRSRSRRSRSRRLAAASIRTSRTCRLRRGCPQPRNQTAASSPAAPGTKRRCSCAEALEPGQRIDGPGADHRAASDRGGRARLAGRGHARRIICCSRGSPNGRRACAGDLAPDPVLLEVFNKRFTAIAEQMGYALQNTARSVNIKERLDFSCAIFDRARRASSPTRRISRCISARWTAASRRCCARSAQACSPATCGC